MTNDLRKSLERRIAAYRKGLASAPSVRALDAHYPIRTHVPYAKLADGLPTPITPHDGEAGTLWVKRDDLTSSLYGGNKVRKLEYVLAAAATRNCTPVAVGATASHQVLATAVFGHMLGIGSAAVLFPQPPSPAADTVRAVLESLDVPIHMATSPYTSPLATARALLARRGPAGPPCLVYPGSSSPAGILGYVDCALEIVDTVRAGQCPEPDVIVTAYGTGGTAVGLALGAAVGGLRTRVLAVRVADVIVGNRWHLKNQEWRTRRFLRELGESVPRAMPRLEIVGGYIGEGYGHRLPSAAAAAGFATSHGLPVDDTYTAKALQAALDYQKANPSHTVMFLETLSGANPLVPAPR